MKHFGDITKISGYAVPVVDIVTGGSPCQDLSVAGKRAGLAGERSGLFMEQIRIIKEMRKHYVETNGLVGILRTEKAGIKPRYMVWENVPGAFSSNNGEDFRAVLEETARVAEEGISIPRLKEGQKWSNAGAICGNGWSIAWRVHDAQYWGVPQRRKRISLLADFNGYSAADILFECFRETSVDGVYETVTNTGNESRREIQSIGESVPRNFEPGRTERETVAGDVKGSIRKTGNGTVKSIAFEPGVASRVGGHIYEDLSGTLRANAGDNMPAVLCLNNQDGTEKEVVVYDNNPTDARLKPCADGIAPTVKARMGTGGNNTPLVMDRVVSFTTEMTPKIDNNGIAFSLRERDYKDAQSVAYGASSFGQYKDGFSTLKANGGDIGGGSETLIVDSISFQERVGKPSIVRRLTPLECTRLQGFPDGWVDIGEWTDSKGKVHKDADSPKYKALGNSIALPFWKRLAERISAEMEKDGEDEPTMASLFDGIGGFPLAFSKAGIKPVWASEIEEFPIAVTKFRFPEDKDDDI